MTFSKKRKTRPQPKGEKEIEAQVKEVVTKDSTPDYESTGQESTSKLAIDQIRAELFEERYAPSVEPEYEDESHSWGDNETESEEYWHFLGRYE